MRMMGYVCVAIALVHPLAAIAAPSTDVVAKKGVLAAIARSDAAMNSRDPRAMERRNGEWVEKQERCIREWREVDGKVVKAQN